MASVSQSDTSLWLHNKLGTSNDSWTGGSIVSQLSPDILVKIKHCFQDLQPQVKLKLLLAFFHISRRNLEIWRPQLDQIIDVAMRDSEPWVSMLAELMKTFPGTGQLNPDVAFPESNRRIYMDLLADLKKTLKKHGEQKDSVLPLEMSYLNKNAFISVVGHQPQPGKHFHLKRKPKAAALKAELMQKSQEAANKVKSQSSSAFPARVRTMPKKMSDSTPMKGLPSRPLHNSGFRPPRTSLPSRQPGKKEGGVKLLDITEQPMGYAAAKKRKRQQDLEDAKRAAEEAATQVVAVKSEAHAQANPTPDYATHLSAATLNPPPASLAPPAYVPPVPQAAPAAPPPPVYAPLPPSVSVPLATPTGLLTGTPVTVALPTTPLPPVTAGGRLVQLPTQPLPQMRVAGLQQTPVNLIQQQPQQQQQQQSVLQPQGVALAQRTVLQPHNLLIQQPRPTFIQTIQPQQQILRGVASISLGAQRNQVLQPVVQSIAAPVAAQQGQRRSHLSLTREQMLEAQEMFRTANKVTRPEKALILGFMAGSRDNPCPHLGNIVTIKLSENQENVLQTDNTYLTMIVETHFQMNYNTGEWKRIKKYRRLEDVLQ